MKSKFYCIKINGFAGDKGRYIEEVDRKPARFRSKDAAQNEIDVYVHAGFAKREDCEIVPYEAVEVA